MENGDARLSSNHLQMILPQLATCDHTHAARSSRKFFAARPRVGTEIFTGWAAISRRAIRPHFWVAAQPGKIAVAGTAKAARYKAAPCAGLPT
jgi:hypothetical protein